MTGDGRPRPDPPDPEPDALAEIRETVARATAGAGERKQAEPPLHLVAFRLGPAHYAFHLEDLDEIFALRPITRVPFTPEHVLGVLNYRGEVLPVADLRRVFGVAAEPPGPRARILVARRGEVRLGVLAEEISEVLTTTASRVEPPLATLAAPVRRFVEGAVPLERGAVQVLDLDGLLAGLRPDAAGPG